MPRRPIDPDPDPVPDLPTLEPGVSLLCADDRATGALHSLVLDHLLLRSGTAVWVDGRGDGTTQPLSRLAPSAGLLSRVRIARGFTAYQHYSLLADLDAAVDDDTSLLVLPAVDWRYRADDLRRGEGKAMLERGLALATDAAAARDLPVLVTRESADALSRPVAAAAAEVLRCEDTPFGPRFRGADFETHVYPDAGAVQTTLAFWARVLARRHAAPARARAEVTAGGAD